MRYWGTRVVGGEICEIKKEIEISPGVIPHYVDRNNPLLRKFIEANRDSVKVIDVENDLHHVINEIHCCEHVVSSSLHGIIVSDALGIPNAWIKLSSAVIGDGFKFRDYGSAIGYDLSPISFTEACSLKSVIESMTCRTIDRCIFESLDEMFRRFSGCVLG